MAKKSFPTAKEMAVLEAFIAKEREKNNDQLRDAAKTWIKAHWENKLSYEPRWLGMPVIQTAEDMVAMQEIIYDVRPDYVVETGVAHGGSLVFYASILEMLGHGKVIGVELDFRAHNRKLLFKHPMMKRITLVEGSSIDPRTFAKVKTKIKPRSKVVVILDSNHSHNHVTEEIRLYGSLVSKGSYLIVCDTITPEVDSYKYGGKFKIDDNPKTALDAFLKTTDTFVSDRGREKLGITYFPGGFLKRIK